MGATSRAQSPYIYNRWANPKSFLTVLSSDKKLHQISVTALWEILYKTSCSIQKKKQKQ